MLYWCSVLLMSWLSKSLVLMMYGVFVVLYFGCGGNMGLEWWMWMLSVLNFFYSGVVIFFLSVGCLFWWMLVGSFWLMCEGLLLWCLLWFFVLELFGFVLFCLLLLKFIVLLMGGCFFMGVIVLVFM